MITKSQAGYQNHIFQWLFRYAVLFVNNRVVKDKAIAHAVKRAYSDVMQSGRFRICSFHHN